MDKVNNKVRRKIAFIIIEKLNEYQRISKTRTAAITKTHVPFYNQDTGCIL